MLTTQDLKVIANYSGNDTERLDMANDAIRIAVALERGENLPYSKYFAIIEEVKSPKYVRSVKGSKACPECLGKKLVATGYFDDPKNQEYVPCPKCSKGNSNGVKTNIN